MENGTIAAASVLVGELVSNARAAAGASMTMTASPARIVFWNVRVLGMIRPLQMIKDMIPTIEKGAADRIGLKPVRRKNDDAQ